MPISFPSNPTVGQQSTQNGRTYNWSGAAWETSSVGSAGGAISDSPSDGVTYGRKNGQWVDMVSPANLQVRRGNSSEVLAITPMSGEPVWDTTNKILYVGDGASVGGVRVAYPVITNNFTSDNNIGSTPPASFAPVVLSPLNSVWQLDLFARVQATWGNSNTTALAFKVGGFTGVGTLTGSFVVVDSDNVVTSRRLTASNITLSVADSDEYVIRISAVASITAAAGTVDFAVTTDDQTAEGAIKQWTLIARRIA